MYDNWLSSTKDQESAPFVNKAKENSLFIYFIISLVAHGGSSSGSSVAQIIFFKKLFLAYLNILTGKTGWRDRIDAVTTSARVWVE
jgi:hypothetical protein